MKQLAQKYPVFPYFMAVFVTLIAVAIRWLLNPLLANTLIFVTIYAAVAFSTWLGGYRPTLIATLLGYFLCNFLFLEPYFTLHLNPAQIIGFVTFCMTCGIIMTLGEITRNAESSLKLKEAELRASESNVRQILESITDAFYTLDANWRYTYINPAALDVIGSNLEDLINKVFWDVFPEVVGTEIDTFYRKVVADKVASTLTTYFEPHSRWYEIRAYPTGLGLSVYFRDVTRKMEAEQLLTKQAEKLAEMDQRKNEFLATLAHELRNPLAPIRNSLSIMELKGHDVATVVKTRLVIERQVEQMVRLVDDLMDVSRISHGKLELRRANITLSDVINSAVETSRPALEAAGLELSVNLPNMPVLLNADLTRMAQVFLNLLNNAAKFTNPGGHVSISASLESENVEGGRAIIVMVRDSGIGISPEDQLKIFEGFTQLSNSLKRSHGGLGVGLMLVKRIVEMHGGSVKVHSEGAGLGSAFIVRLPVISDGSTSNTENQTPVKLHHIATQLRVLVVDDNHDAAISLANYFDALGHESVVVHDGASAIEVSEQYQPNVIFLDIGMPGLDGHEVASYIRQQSWGHSIKLFAVTGWGQEEDRNKSAIAGFDAHLVKPVHPQVLTNLLSETFN